MIFNALKKQSKLHSSIGLSQVRHHIELYTDENEAVKEIFTAITMAQTV